MYAPDLPGFGESDPPAARPSVADYAAALGDFLDSMRLRQIDLLAQRGGARSPLSSPRRARQQIGRVVMVSVPLLSEAERQGRAAAPPAAELPGRPPEWQRWGAEAAAQYPLRERLARLSQRLLVLRPRDDLWDATGRVRDVQPAARVTDLEMSGAELFSSRPARLVEPLRDFLHR